MTSRCPDCAAAVGPAATWCSLCFASLHTPPPETQRAAEPASGTAAAGAFAEPPAPLAAQVWTPGGAWPCACGATVPLAQSRCAACGSGFLDDLAGVGGTNLFLAAMGRLEAMGRMARAGVLGLAAFLLTFALIVLLWLAGTML